MIYNIDIMKKRIFIFVAILTLTMLTLAFAGCNNAFDKNGMREQIEDNLGWHSMTKTEVSEYDVIKDGEIIGSYTTTVNLIAKQDVVVEAIDSANNYSLTGFTGYKFTSTLTINDGTSYTTQGYAKSDLSPAVSYTRRVENGKNVEILSVYGEKNIDTTFIIDANKIQSSAKYKNESFVTDSTFLYQFARATDMASALSVTVPSYTMTENLTQVYTQTISLSHMTNSNIELSKDFVLNKEYSNTQTPSGDLSSGEIIDNSDAFGDNIDYSVDASGNVTIKSEYTKTNSIPVKKCTMTADKDLGIKASVSCYIATSPMKNLDGDSFISRAVVMIQEGNITYKLNSIKFI